MGTQRKEKVILIKGSEKTMEEVIFEMSIEKWESLIMHIWCK